MGIKRRMPASSGYIGAGNKSSVFNRKPKIPFEKLKKIYNSEIERKSINQSIKTELSLSQKKEIRTKIRNEIKREKIWNLIYLIIALIFIYGVYFILKILNE